MTVYFVQNKRTKNIKIGYTGKNPKLRLAQLQTSHCDDLVLLEHVRGTAALEHELQNLCKDFLVRNEWFLPGCLSVCRKYIKLKKNARRPLGKSRSGRRKTFGISHG